MFQFITGKTGAAGRFILSKISELNASHSLLTEEEPEFTRAAPNQQQQVQHSNTTTTFDEPLKNGSVPGLADSCRKDVFRFGACESTETKQFDFSLSRCLDIDSLDTDADKVTEGVTKYSEKGLHSQTNASTDDEFIERLHDPDNTEKKSLFQIQLDESIREKSVDFLDIESLLSEDDTHGTKSPLKTKSFVKKAKDSIEQAIECQGVISKQGQKKLKNDHKIKSSKRKLEIDDTGSISDNDTAVKQLLNTRKSSIVDGKTSDDLGQFDKWPEDNDSHFNRRSEARISNLYKWNSVLGVSTPEKKNESQCKENYGKPPVVVEHVNNAIFHSGTADSHGSAIYSIGSSEFGFLLEKVRDQTRNTLENFRQSGPKVQTEGYVATKRLLSDTTKRNKLVFILGNGDGGTTIQYQLLEEICSSYADTPTSETASSKWGADHDSTIPYVLFEPYEWKTVSNEKPAVICFHDASGTIKTDLSLLDECFRRIDQCLLSCNDVTIIVTLKKFPDFHDAIVKNRYQGHVVDLQSKVHIISDDTKVELIENVLERHHIKYCFDEKNENYTEKGRESMRFISHKTVREIANLADRHGFVKSIASFFSGCISEGTDHFIKPEPELVKKIKHMHQENLPEIFALLAVHDYGGELSTERVEQIRRTLKTNKPMSTVALDQFKADTVKTYKLKPFIPQQSLVLKHAKMKKNLEKLGDVLLNGLEHLEEEGLLEETHNIYRFRSEKVKTSLLIFLSSLYPEETLHSCDFNFLLNYVCPRSVGRGKRRLFVPIESNDTCKVKKAMFKRITDEILQRRISKCMQHPVFQESWFVDDLIAYWKQNKHACWKQEVGRYTKKEKDLLWTILRQQESPLAPFGVLCFGMTRQFTVGTNDRTHNVTEKILKQGKWTGKRGKSKYVEWTQRQEHETMLRAITLGRDTTVSLLVEIGSTMTKDIVNEATRTSNVAIIKTFIQKCELSAQAWWEALRYAFEIYSKEDAVDTAKSICSQLIEKADVNRVFGDEQPLIIDAVAKNNQRMTEFLCEMSADNGKFESQKVNIDIKSLDGETALIIATRNRNEPIIQALLDAGAKQNLSDKTGKIPVHLAAERGFTNVLHILINHTSAVLNASTKFGRKTPLHIASETGNIDVVRGLLERKGILINVQDENKQSPLHLAAKAGHYRIIRLLIAKEADMSISDKHRETALCVAVRYRNYSSAEVLLKAQNAKHWQQDDKALLVAVLKDDIHLLELLLKYKYSLNTADKRTGSPLFVAIENNSKGMVTFLLENHAAVDQVLEGRHPIIHAALKSDEEMIKILRGYGADISTRETRSGRSILHIAVETENEGMTSAILCMTEEDSLIDLRNANGETAVHEACRKGNWKILQMLLTKGFSSNLSNRMSETPLLIADIEKSRALKSNDNQSWRRFTKVVNMLRAQQTKVLDHGIRR